MLNLLADITILDFTQLLPGPYCSQLLADMGAKIIKPELASLKAEERKKRSS